MKQWWWRCYGLQITGEEEAVPIDAGGRLLRGKFRKGDLADLRWVRRNKELLGAIEELLLPQEEAILWEGETCYTWEGVPGQGPWKEALFL